MSRERHSFDPEGNQSESRNRRSNQALINAIENNDWGTFSMLMGEKSISIDAPDGNGVTPLMAAINKGNKGFISLILDRSPNVDAVAANGDTALSIATQKRDWFSISLLKSRGAKQ